MAAKSGESTGIPVAYISFSTLIGLLDRLHERGVPHRIDPSFLDNYAGGYRPTILASLRALGLIDTTGSPTDALVTLAKGDDAPRRKAVAELVRTHYHFLLTLPNNATQAQMEEAFEKIGVRGDTRRKAAAFFIKAAEYGGIAHSTHWRVPKVPPTSRRTPRRATTGQDALDELPPTTPPSALIRDGLPSEIVGLLRKIPNEGEAWPWNERKRFTLALNALFDLFYPDSGANPGDPLIEDGMGYSDKAAQS